MMELVLLGISFGLVVIHELLHWILVDSQKIVRDESMRKSMEHRYILRWSRVIGKQRRRVGIGTTLPFLMLVLIAVFQVWITFFVAIEYMDVFYIISFILMYIIIRTIVAIPYSYKNK